MASDNSSRLIFVSVEGWLPLIYTCVNQEENPIIRRKIFILTVLAAVPGFARSSTGINSFHVMWPGSAYSCLKEDYAAVVNDCTYTATLTFDMPIDNTGWHGIDVVDYPKGAGSFGCQAITYNPYGHVDWQTDVQTFKTRVSISNGVPRKSPSCRSARTRSTSSG